MKEDEEMFFRLAEKEGRDGWKKAISKRRRRKSFLHPNRFTTQPRIHSDTIEKIYFLRLIIVFI